MIRSAWCLAFVSAILMIWHECGENLGLFCYRIGWGAFYNMRSRTLAPVAISPDITRTPAACSNRSFTSSVHSIAPMD
jgi:hypothetical protein